MALRGRPGRPLWVILCHARIRGRRGAWDAFGEVGRDFGGAAPEVVPGLAPPPPRGARRTLAYRLDRAQGSDASPRTAPRDAPSAAREHGGRETRPRDMIATGSDPKSPPWSAERADRPSPRPAGRAMPPRRRTRSRTRRAVRTGEEHGALQFLGDPVVHESPSGAGPRNLKRATAGPSPNIGRATTEPQHRSRMWVIGRFTERLQCFRPLTTADHGSATVRDPRPHAAAERSRNIRARSSVAG
jgi:hypothetical protein